jgi:hypothetical protein
MISDHLGEHSKTLSDYGLPEPLTLNMAVEQELGYFAHIIHTLLSNSEQMYTQMNREQRQLFDYFLAGINDPSQLRNQCNFLEGMAGRGKSFLIHAL